MGETPGDRWTNQDLPLFRLQSCSKRESCKYVWTRKKSYLQRICLTNGTCSVHPCSISRSLPRMPNHYYLHFSFDKLLKSERCSKFASERKLHKKAFGTFRPFLTFPAQKTWSIFVTFFLLRRPPILRFFWHPSRRRQHVISLALFLWFPFPPFYLRRSPGPGTVWVAV